MAVLQFLGKDDYNTNIIGEPIMLEEDQKYLAEIQLDSPQMLINGIPVDCADATYWVILNNGRTKIPYSKECLEKKWKVIKAQ